ncbi:MAG: TIGR01777 family oxidoreductase [Desulfobacteraceae bacterium]|jgi:uncharacterized protein (TIGR01777 family)
MEIFITGGTGFVGSVLSESLLEKGHSVKILTRSIRSGNEHSNRLSFVEGDPAQKGQWLAQLAACDVVINLAGASIFKRWTTKYKQTLIESRILTTRNIIDGLSDRKRDNVLLISTSAVGYYGFHGDEQLDESASPGRDFLASLSMEWEAAANDARNSGARVILNRLGVVLGKGGGAIPMMTPLYKYWIGSPLGNGRQYFSWIHIKDLINIILFQIENKGLDGPFNCTAPNPVTNRELTHTIAAVMNKPLLMPPVPGFMMKIIMGEFADVLLKGQRVIPKKLMDAGFSFEFPEIKSALEDIILRG